MLRTPKQDEVVVIYETRKNRVSGAHTQVIDLRPVGNKYAVRCVTHDYASPRNVRLASEAESHKSHEWCPSCIEVLRASQAPVFVADVREWTVEMVLDTIGNATSKKTCVKRADDAITEVVIESPEATS